MAMVMAFLLLFDPIVTPIPFRVAYVLPTALLATVVSAITVHLSADQKLAVLSIAASLGLSFVLGFFITIYARIIYVMIHRNRVLFALNPFSQVSPPRPDVAARATQ